MQQIFNQIRPRALALSIILFLIGAAKVHADILYVSNSGNSTIEKVTSGGVGSTFVTTAVNGPEGLAFDAAANLYCGFYSTASIQKFTPGGIGSTFTTGADSVGYYGLALDSAQTLYAVADDVNSTVGTVEKFSSNGTHTTFGTTGGYGFGEVFDKAGSLYVSDFTDNQIVKFTTNGTRSIFASSGVSGPRGLAFDSAGNLYLANVTNNTIEKFNTSGVGSVFASSGLNYPIGLAFDSVGNLYAANLNGNSIEKYTTGGVASVFATTGINQPTFLAFTSDAGVPLPLTNQTPEPSLLSLSAAATILCTVRSRRLTGFGNRPIE